MDEDLAEHLEDRGDDAQGPPTLAVSETTPEVLLLLRLVALTQAQLQSKQKKRIPFPPLPTIRTARTVVRERRRQQHRGRLERLVADAKARWVAQQDHDPTEADLPSEDSQVWTDPT